MTKDQFIFEKLELGCWHDVGTECVENMLTGQIVLWCKKCEKSIKTYQHVTLNPSFTTWEDCGRLLDHLQTDPRAENFCEMLRTEQSLCCLHEEHMPLSQLKPTILRDKLAEFLGWDNLKEKGE